MAPIASLLAVQCLGASYLSKICVWAAAILYVIDIIHVNDFPVHMDNHINFICLQIDDNKLYARIADLNDCHCLQLELGC